MTTARPEVFVPDVRTTLLRTLPVDLCDLRARYGCAVNQGVDAVLTEFWCDVTTGHRDREASLLWATLPSEVQRDAAKFMTARETSPARRYPFSFTDDVAWRAFRTAIVAEYYCLSISEVRLAAICDGIRARIFESKGTPKATVSLPTTGGGSRGELI